MEMSRWLIARASIFLWIMGLIKRMTIGVRVILIDGDKVLLIKHSYIPGWHFPGGGVDHAETIDEAAVREVREETGYEIKAPLEFFAHYINTIPPRRDHVAVFVSHDFAKADEFVRNREIIEIGWFPLAELPADASKATVARLEELAGDKARARSWRD